MRILERLGRAVVVLGAMALASYFALTFGTGGLWRGLEAAHAVTAGSGAKAPYDLTQLQAVNETLKTVRDKYVEPSRIRPQQMFLSALNQVQREVAQVIILHQEKSPTVKVRVETEERSFRVDNVQGPWDVAARLREVFVFLQQNLKDTEVDLRDVEYAACNGILRTLDPHSIFLSPEAYREMNMSTSGHFGGLGIVISIRDQMLTIMRPMPDTPAGRANLKRLDRITKINNESTLNMPLDDAVKRLRGKPGSKVTIWVHREGADGWQGSRPFELTREEIRIRSIDSRPLGPGVGYVRIKQFQQSTDDELDAALSELSKTDRLKGLVLDLRSNPGGLLDQAAKVADRFLDSGVIVSTVGASEGREEKKASRRDTQPTYPIVVLVNGSSASASEIVAGALKNHDRAVVVGQTTFGKGSVQLVFPRVTPDGAALKLTIAQYLTPGDVSIQGVGVGPDIQLDPMTADLLEMDLFSEENPFKERDLSKSLGSTAKRSVDRPFFKLRFNLPESERAKLRDLGGDVEDEFHLDFPITFGRDLVSKLSAGRRPDQLRAAQSFLDRTQDAQVAAVAADLSKLGIDWSPAPKSQGDGTRASDFEVTVTTDRKDHQVTAGQPMHLSVSVKNNAKVAAHQLRAITKSDSGYYTEKELVFGRVGPGETKTAKVPLGWCEIEGRKPGSTRPLPTDAKRSCKIPMDALDRQDVVKVRFHSDGGEAPAEAELRPTISSLPRPVFAYAYQVVDDRPGNGDGQLARGEGVTVYLTVKNVGKGRSYETQANLRNLTGDGLLLRAGRFDISNMAPGDVREVAFTFDVMNALTESFAKVEVSVSDRDLRVVSSEKLNLPVTRSGLFVTKAEGLVRAEKSLGVRGQPLATVPVVGQVEKGTVLERLGTFASFTKVRLDGTRFGWVETSALGAGAGVAKVKLTPALTRSPPVLQVDPAALATRGDKVHIEAVATDGDRVIDAYVFVGSRKVFYQSNRKGADPKKMRVSFDAPLLPGTNVVTVVARESEDTATRHTMVIRRDGPNGEALPTPKGEEFGADWDFGGGDE
ncbi:MAG: PDZ domain-containing protein [Polyangiaceae bacterium]|nr:PDZ domain-containing protein [Polyangiaceae bacterium]